VHMHYFFVPAILKGFGWEYRDQSEIISRRKRLFKQSPLEVTAVWHSLLRQIRFSELKHVEAIGEGGFGVVHRAKHPRLGTVVYKELKSSIIADGSKFVLEIIHNK